MIIESLIGTVAGFIGTGITTYANYRMKLLEVEENKTRREHDLNMVRAESEARIAEVRANIRVAQVQTEGAVLLEEAAAYAESQRQGNRRVFESEWAASLLDRKDGLRFVTIPFGMALCALFGLSDAIQSLMRPALTLYSAAIATWVTWRAWEIMQTADLAAFTTSQAMGQWNQAAGVAYTLAVTLITWWFGDRRVAKNLMHQNRQETGAAK